MLFRSGFNPPIGRWLRGPLRSLVTERLHPRRLADIGIRSEFVGALIQEHQNGRRDNGLKLWALIVYEAWARLHATDGLGLSDAA